MMHKERLSILRFLRKELCMDWHSLYRVAVFLKYGKGSCVLEIWKDGEVIGHSNIMEKGVRKNVK